MLPSKESTSKVKGFVVLKKNGRIGTRTKGIVLARMVGEVVDRRDAGLDVRNI